MPESTQHKLDRVRPPRVQITYDVETRGSFVKMELPFVAGILADLSGNVPDSNRPALRDRTYVEIDGQRCTIERSADETTLRITACPNYERDWRKAAVRNVLPGKR